MDLELAGADRRLHPVPVAAGVRERLRDRRLARAVEAQHAPSRRRAAARAPAAPARSRARSATAAGAPTAGPAGRRPRRAPRVEHHPGRRARQAERDRVRRKGRLLAHAVLEVGVRPLQPLGDHPRDRPDLLVQALVEHELAARSLRDELDRPVVVRRPEPAGDEAEVGAEAFPQRRLQLVGTVADDRDPRRLEAERERLCGEERPVQVGALAADELAARDDDRGAWPPRR